VLNAVMITLPTSLLQDGHFLRGTSRRETLVLDVPGAPGGNDVGAEEDASSPATDW
jgi:hypothetical protein